jgi:hypothetical protein
VSGVYAILGAVLLLGLTLRIGTAVLVVTGLSRDIARFQVRSAFFGVGYTTSEAEAVVNHPVRRRTVQALMLLGSVGITGVIGSAVITLARTDDVLVPILVLAGGLFALWLLTTWQALDRLISRLLERLLRRWTDLDTHDYHALLRISSDYLVQQITVRSDAVIVGHSLAEARDRVPGLVLLGIEHADGSYVGAPSVDTTIRAGDTLTVYGHTDALEALEARAPR